MMLRYKQSRQAGTRSSLRSKTSIYSPPLSASCLPESPTATPDKTTTMTTLSWSTSTTFPPGPTIDGVSTRSFRRRVSLPNEDDGHNSGKMLWECDDVSIGRKGPASSIMDQSGRNIASPPLETIEGSTSTPNNKLSPTRTFDPLAPSTPNPETPPKRGSLGFMSDSSTITSISGTSFLGLSPDSPTVTSTLPMAVTKIPIILAASALLSLKSNDSKYSEKSNKGEGANDDQDISGEDDDDESSLSTSSVMDDMDGSCSSYHNTGNSSCKKKNCVAVKAAKTMNNKKKFPRKLSMDLSTPLPVTIKNDGVDTGYKRISSKLLNNPNTVLTGLRLASPLDRKFVNALHKFVRAELLEVIVLSTRRVGLRCVHCGLKDKSKRSSMSTFYPKSISDLYRSVCTWQRIHFKSCLCMPEEVKEKYWQLKDEDRTRGKKAHWISSAMDMGFVDVDDNRSGIMYCLPIHAGPQDSIEDGMDYESEVKEVMV